MPLSKPKLSLCALALPFTDLDEDIALAKAVGAGGLGLDENKLAADPAALAGQRERFVASGIAATVCAPAILSILPRDPSRDSGPRAPEERLRLIEGGIDKLAAFGADSVFCATGPVGDLDDGEARKIVVDGLRRLSKRAADAGTRFAVEPMREPFRPIWTIVNGLGQASELFEEVGEPLGIVFDTWHLWDSPDVRALIPANVDRIVGVQIADYRQPPRHIRDRVAAGEGVADLAGLSVPPPRASTAGTTWRSSPTCRSRTPVEADAAGVQRTPGSPIPRGLGARRRPPANSWRRHVLDHLVHLDDVPLENQDKEKGWTISQFRLPSPARTAVVLGAVPRPLPAWLRHSMHLHDRSDELVHLHPRRGTRRRRRRPAADRPGLCSADAEDRPAFLPQRLRG